MGGCKTIISGHCELCGIPTFAAYQEKAPCNICSKQLTIEAFQKATESDKEKIKLNFIVGEHPEVEDRIVIAFDGTGLNVNNPEDKLFLNAISEVIIAHMYAKANGIPFENIVLK